MPQLDPRTIILLVGIMGALMSMVLFFLRRNFPKSIHGLTAWALAPAIIFVATLMLGLRGVIPNLLSMALANTLLLCGLTLLYFGTKRFFDELASIRHWCVVLLVAAFLLVWYSNVRPHYGWFLCVISVFIAAISLLHARLLWRRSPRGFASYLTGASLATLAATQVGRLVYAVGLPAQSTLFAMPPLQNALITLYAFCMLLIPVGLVLMATDRLRAEFEHLASHDYLTGALTRRALTDACEQELHRYWRQQRPTALLMMDLDHFKTVNDLHGHLTGDRVLVEFASIVVAQLRRTDSFGRYGGEEFVVLLPETTLDCALGIAERIRNQVASGSLQPPCTVSVGVTDWYPDDSGVDVILARADAALYQAKTSGRNCVKVVCAIPVLT